MQIFSFFHNLGILLFSQIVFFFIINWQWDFVESNSVCNHTPDDKVWLETELDSTQSYYYY